LTALEYNRLSEAGVLLIQEEPKRYDVPKARHASCIPLIEEIQKLRVLMEKAAGDEGDLSSELVIEISMRLDEKINEYMTWRRRAGG